MSDEDLQKTLAERAREARESNSEHEDPLADDSETEEELMETLDGDDLPPDEEPQETEIEEDPDPSLDEQDSKVSNEVDHTPPSPALEESPHEYDAAIRRVIDGLPADIQLEIRRLMQGRDFDDELWQPLAGMAVIATHFAKTARQQAERAGDLDKRSERMHDQLKEVQGTIDNLPEKVESRISNLIEERLDAKLKEVLNGFGEHANTRFEEQRATLTTLIRDAWERSIGEVAAENSIKLFRVFSKPILGMLLVPLGAGVLIGVLLALGLNA